MSDLNLLIESTPDLIDLVMNALEDNDKEYITSDFFKSRSI